MKIALAQIKPYPGRVERNIKNHIYFLEKAISQNADLVLFPELSLTGYEPKLAHKLALDADDSHLNLFQGISDENGISIAIGLPLKTKSAPGIGMICFLPRKDRKVYSKQLLHADELPFFTKGEQQLLLNIRNHKIAPAICYESLQKEHLAKALSLGADVYMASVAKSQKALEKALVQYPMMAKEHAIPIFMVNATGKCDDFICAGQTSVWDKYGSVVHTMEAKSEGLLICDLSSDGELKSTYRG